MKKVLVIILIIILLGLGITGGVILYNKYTKQVEDNEILTAQNMQLQNELTSIGNLTTAYQPIKKLFSGDIVREEDLVPVTTLISADGTASVTDVSEIVGKMIKVDVNPGTYITKDIVSESSAGVYKFTRELTLMSVPVTTAVGDYIDIRIILPNGEEYTVLDKKRIINIYNNTTLTIEVTEEEHYLLNSAIQDAANYQGTTLLYAIKYLEPGAATTVAYYPVQHDMENFIRFNPNINDITRCINETMRDHIDEVLLTYTTSANVNMASSFISGLTAQLGSQLAMQSEWVAANEDEDGEVVIDTQTPESSDVNVDINQQTGDAMESLEEDLEDLEAIK